MDQAVSGFYPQRLNQGHVPIVPRPRSSHNFAAGSDANFGFKIGTTGMELLVSLSRLLWRKKLPKRKVKRIWVR
jgi:hypothetical protein